MNSIQATLTKPTFARTRITRTEDSTTETQTSRVQSQPDCFEESYSEPEVQRILELAASKSRRGATEKPKLSFAKRALSVLKKVALGAAGATVGGLAGCIPVVGAVADLNASLAGESSGFATFTNLAGSALWSAGKILGPGVLTSIGIGSATLAGASMLAVSGLCLAWTGAQIAVERNYF